MKITFIFFFMVIIMNQFVSAQDMTKRARAREIGIEVGLMKPGAVNAITDVPGVRVGHTTIIRGDNVRTGVTAVVPHPGNIFQEKVPAGIHCYNAFGKLAGYTQVEELGNIETPIVLTNTLSVGTAMTALVKYTLDQPGNESVRSVNAVVGETNDGALNDIRGFHVTEGDVLEALKSAASGPVPEGTVGAGTGTTAFSWKGGIGTSSRLVPRKEGTSYTVGVLLQSNFGGLLSINGIPFTREINQPGVKSKTDGSCMIVVATDAPLSDRNLKRLAKRAFNGMARTTNFMANSSGDYTIAFSTAYRIPHNTNGKAVEAPPFIANDDMNQFFNAVEEAVQEAVYNSLFMAITVTGFQGRKAEAINLEDVKRVMQKYNMLELQKRLK
ncbi:MAG: P1 family peptidase [Candidatus Latescibacter sp.]|nr:P1 family peptidase [Candidatus Latescibacter sp.]